MLSLRSGNTRRATKFSAPPTGFAPATPCASSSAATISSSTVWMPLTGKSVWTYETGNYINGAPAVGGGKVVFGGCDGMLHVLDAATGKDLAAIEVGDYIPGSAVITGNHAYVGHYGDEVLCLDLAGTNICAAFDADQRAVLLLAGRHGKACDYRGTRQATSLSRSRHRQAGLDLCHARRCGQLAGSRRRQGGVRFWRWPALPREPRHRKKTLVV